MLEIDGLRKRYGDVVALDGVSLTVAPGEMFGFVGANGAGKTTTMRIVMGVLSSDGGEVRWKGAPVGHDTRRRFGYMPEERGLYAKMRVAEQIEYFGRLGGMSPEAARRSAGDLIERLSLTERRGDDVDSLSLGNQQRVQLAVALIHDPELLVLDEPFSGLDPIAVDALAGVLAERKAAGVPVVFSSHQLDLVERLCDSVGIIKAGRLIAGGTVAELRARESRKLLRVVVTGAAPGWTDRLPGEIVSKTDRPRHGTPDAYADDRYDEVILMPTDDQEALRVAVQAGRVQHFAWQQPSLTEIFREVVA
ncbi:ABC transporter ATP-binding protein [Sphaerisporangium krabiense]|uniref:ABC-2 type transport system ATP-binding protein n=1 Tax=Sphaerisporangium krabiense TaxID=763782 RepID=A0A7W8Z6X4_9ACTN|nr:ATP-binding cassette domain-containing protein [Sphaerisporangium krabiense]MBB5628511.1 ABC-2 type transport system ATP-binding protein [Sphaerisporangium krabiense]GII67152.1 ABC transporter ATP-binding protein [Sphaerisporangium krabiense]